MAIAVNEWRPIPGYEDNYEVSSDGRVLSIERTRAGKNGIPTRMHPRILKTQDIHGYQRVCLSKGGVNSFRYVHRLVAEAFIENPSHLPEVNHKDGDKAHNAVDNLEWLSHIDNGRHAAALGLLATGDRHGRRKAMVLTCP